MNREFRFFLPILLTLLVFLLPATLQPQLVLQRCDVTNRWQGSNTITGGNTYVLTTEDGTWDYSIEGLGRGDYEVWYRWADGSCPAELATIAVEADPIPVTCLK